MKRILIAGAVGAVLFVVTVLGLLAAQGRLNHAGTRHIPGLASFFPAPAQPDAGSAQDPGAAAAEGTAATPSRGVQAPGLGKEPPLPYRRGAPIFGDAGAPGDRKADPKTDPKPDAKPPDAPVKDGPAPGGSAPPETSPPDPAAKEPAAESSTEWRAKVDTLLGQGQYRQGRLWTFPQIEAGIGVDELNDVLRKAREARDDVERERSALQRQKGELEARERDVADRQDVVLEKLREVEQLRAKLQAEIDEFHDTVLLIRQDEVSGLQAVAKTLAAVEPKSAAMVIQKWWQTDEGQTRALKVWTVMSPDAANAILGEMDVEMIRQVLEKRLKVAREQTKGKR